MAFKAFLLFISAMCLIAHVSSLQRNCGQRFLDSPPGRSRIIGGLGAREGAWPWQVSIQIGPMHFCGGVIISEHWVLTAAHCVREPLNKSISIWVVAGVTDLSVHGSHYRKSTIHKSIIHKDYKRHTSNCDIALLRLSSPLYFSHHIQPICIADSVPQELNISSCFITGWGSISYRGQKVDRLREAVVGLFDNEVCNQADWHRGRITVNMICAGKANGSADTCQGDSGGPLQCHSESDGRFYSVGVTSFGFRCGLPHKPGVYARTSIFADWLRTTVETEEMNEIPTSAAHSLDASLTTALSCAACMLLHVIIKYQS